MDSVAADGGTLAWAPSNETRENSTIFRYMRWLGETRGLHFEGYHGLWEWSVGDLEAFWASIWDFSGIISSRSYDRVLPERGMPGAKWFTGAELNYVDHVFRNRTAERPALVFRSEAQPLTEVSWEELYRKVCSLAAALRDMGVGRGDRVAAYIPNIPESVIAFLACASIGAIWSSCSPDFGATSVRDRFAQIEPKVLFCVDGYRYNGKAHDRRPVLEELQQSLPTLQGTVLVPYLDRAAVTEGLPSTVVWDELLSDDPPELAPEQVPFDHPLWVLYSSGTTGLPKPIVQGHGGILLEHLKKLQMHMDITPADRLFWFTTTGWMMWNLTVGGLLAGCTVVLYDGSPAHPDMNALWQFAQEAGVTWFGASAPYIAACMKAGITPGETYDMSALRAVGSTGAPLPPEGFRWVYDRVKEDIWLNSLSGGTDVCSAFVGGCALLPVYLGEIQCRALGAKVEAFDEKGAPLIDEVGELVLTEPLPSMPLFFWNDPEGARYRESYFDIYPGVWRHGDWVKITPRGSVVIYGRSDSTINRQGVRMGSSEIYSAVESLPEVLDSLVVDLESLGRESYMALFVVLADGVQLDDSLRAKIKQQIRTALSPRHVPDEILTIGEAPRTLNGKKLEVPVKKILMGMPLEKAANPGSLANPRSLDPFVELAKRLNSSSSPPAPID